MASLCRKCGGDGHVSRSVMVVGPVRPTPGMIFQIGDVRLSYVPAGLSASAYCSYPCHVCKGSGKRPE